MTIVSHLRTVATLLLFMVTVVLSAQPAVPDDAKSAFVMPGSPKDGRDPFFPNSTRPYESSPSAKNVDNALLHTLKIGSIMDGGVGRVFAVINNHTFAPGEEGSVIADDGQRINIRCLDINASAGTVTIESSGARATLNFSDK
jgi:hypothetical protein